MWFSLNRCLIGFALSYQRSRLPLKWWLGYRDTLPRTPQIVLSILVGQLSAWESHFQIPTFFRINKSIPIVMVQLRILP